MEGGVSFCVWRHAYRAVEKVKHSDLGSAWRRPTTLATIVGWGHAFPHATHGGSLAPTACCNLVQCE
jgi:hypothetical protein